MEIEEPQAETPKFAGVTAIRDALQALLPEDPNIVIDVKVHDGLAESMVRWRNLRWSSVQAINGQEPEQIAAKVEAGFRQWLRDAIKNMAEIPRHARVLAEIKSWLAKNPDKQKWLYRVAA